LTNLKIPVNIIHAQVEPVTQRNIPNERQDIGIGHGIGGFQRCCYGSQRAYTTGERSQGSVQDGAWQAEVQEATQESIQASQGQVIEPSLFSRQSQRQQLAAFVI